MAKIERIRELQLKLKALKNKAAEGGKRPSVLVGFTAAYAIYVHENMEMKLAGEPRPSGIATYWSPEGSGPKFLEGPAREMRSELAQIVTEAMQNGATLLQALTVAGMRLQREAQLRVPVEYGNLKNSAFTRQETS